MTIEESMKKRRLAQPGIRMIGTQLDWVVTPLNLNKLLVPTKELFTFFYCLTGLAMG
ncbi:MAG: hypothetical protein HS126_24730 [Anaerolineales bacterium]|nr:hypothetical protein [Anaerolineales bacterium]